MVFTNAITVCWLHLHHGNQEFLTNLDYFEHNSHIPEGFNEVPGTIDIEIEQNLQCEQSKEKPLSFIKADRNDYRIHHDRKIKEVTVEPEKKRRKRISNIIKKQS